MRDDMDDLIAHGDMERKRKREEGETDDELFAKARAHMEKFTSAASLDRRLWDATVRLVLRTPRPEGMALENLKNVAVSDGTIVKSASLTEETKSVLLAAREELIWAEGHWGADYHEITEKIEALLKRLAPQPSVPPK